MGRTTVRKSDAENVVDFAGPALAVPLFPDAGADDDVPASISVSRVAPADGYLGSAAPGITEDWLREAYGGGTYELALRNGAGAQLGAPRRIKIAGPPLARPDIEARTADRAATDAAGGGAMALQSQLFREQIGLLRAESEAARERAKMELELTLRRQREEAELREQRDRQHFEREMARERERSERERSRDSEARQADAERHQQFLLAMQALQKEQTSVLVAALQQREDRADPLEVVERMMPLLEGRVGGDPAAENARAMWATASKALEMAAAAKAEDAARPRPVAAKVAGAAPAADGAPADLKTLLLKTAARLKGEGVDLVQVLQAINEGKLTLVPSDWAVEAQQAIAELDAAEEAKGTPDAGAQPETAGMAASGRENEPGPDGAAVVPNPRKHGGSTAPGAPGAVDG